MLLNHTLCEVMDSSVSWEGKFIPGICIYPLPVSGGMVLFQTICLQVSRCCSQGMKPYQGLSVGLYCQHMRHSDQIRSDQSLSRVRLFATPWIAAHQASLSITNSWSSLRLKSIESVMPSNHLILCDPLLLLPPIPPSIRVFSSESTLHEVAKVLEFQL